MRRWLVVLFVVAWVIAACGGDDDGGGSTDAVRSDDASGADADDDDSSGGDGAASSGAVVDKQPAGQAKATVDDLEFTFTVPGAVACTVSDDEFSFSFIIGDNEVVVGGGGVRSDDGWLAAPALRISDPEGEDGPIGYVPASANPTIALDGNSLSISGPMQKQPANDGTNPPPVDVGDGVFTFTCP